MGVWTGTKSVKPERSVADDIPNLTKEQCWNRLIQMLTRARALLPWDDELIAKDCERNGCTWNFQELLDNNEFKLAADELVAIEDKLYKWVGVHLERPNDIDFWRMMVDIYRFTLDGMEEE